MNVFRELAVGRQPDRQSSYVSSFRVSCIASLHTLQHACKLRVVYCSWTHSLAYTDRGMRARFACNLLAIWAICVAHPACSTASQQPVSTERALNHRNTREIHSFQQHERLSRAQHDAAHIATRRALQGQTAEDAAAIEALAKAQQAAKRAAAPASLEARADGTDAAALPAGGSARSDAGDSVAAAEGPARPEADEEPSLTRSQAHEMLNMTSTAMPRLMRPLPPEGRTALERHRACGAVMLSSDLSCPKSATAFQLQAPFCRRFLDAAYLLGGAGGQRPADGGAAAGD